MARRWLILGAAGHGRSLRDVTGTLVNGTPVLDVLISRLGLESVV